MPPATHKKTRTEYPEQHERQAARKYLEHDHAARNLKGEPARIANRNARAIDEEHPRARDIALAGTQRELVDLPQHLRAHQRRIRQEAGLSREQIAEIRREFRSRPYRDPEQQQQQEERQPRLAPVVDRGVGAIGSGLSTAADTSWGGLLVDLFMAGVGLSIAYLVLTKTKGVSEIFTGGVNVTRAIISPHLDPLNPKGTK